MRRDTHKGLSIFNRLLVFFLGAAIVFTAGLSAVFYAFSRNSLEEHIAEDIQQDFSVLGTRFDNDLKGHAIRDMQLLASNPVLDEFMMSSAVEREVNARLVERLFLQSIRYSDSYETISFVDYAGKERIRVAGTGRIKRYRDISKTRFFASIQAGAAGSIHIDGPFLHKNGTASFLVGINKTDPDIGQFGGAIVIRHRLEEFLVYLDEMRVSGEHVVWVLAPDGTALKQPDGHEVTLDPRPYLSTDVRNVPALLEEDEGIVIYRDFSIVPGRPLMRIIIGVPSSLLLKDVRSVLRFLFFVFLLALPILSFVAYALSRHISRPIVGLARAAEELAKGDLSTRVAVQTTGEVQMLVESFNRMAEDLALTTVSKEYVDNIINSMIDTLVVVSPEGSILQANAAACSLLGYTEEELLGKGIEMIIKEGVQSSSTALDDLITMGYVGNTEQTYIAKDGRLIPVLFSGAAMQDGDGEVQGIVCVAQDITARKQMEAELRNSEEKHKNLFHQSNDAILIHDVTGAILDANQKVSDLFGYSRSEVLSFTVQQLHPPEALENSQKAFAALERDGFVNFSVDFRKKSGDVFAAEVSSSLFEIAGEKAVQGIVRDVTERKRAQEELKNFAQKLEKSNKELEEFAYVASHDLQEPLRKVTAFGDQLKTKYGKKLGEKGGDYLERMQAAARRMQGLINNLLTYSRVTTKAQPFVPVDLGNLAQEVLSDLEVRIEQTNGRVDVGDLPTIDADPLQMRQLFQNLIGNALKFHRDGEPPVVTIRSALISGNKTEGEQAAADGDLCRITFADNGIGFDDKYTDRVFGVFQRLHGRSEYEGTGIGLAICRKLVERHGGTLTAKSAPGQGTVFTAELPVAHERGEDANE